MNINECRERIKTASSMRELVEFANYMSENKHKYSKEENRALAGLYAARLICLASAAVKPQNTTIH